MLSQDKQQFKPQVWGESPRISYVPSFVLFYDHLLLDNLLCVGVPTIS